MNLYVRRDYKTISAALTAAKDGDCVIIPSGIYREKLFIDKKDISLIGDGFVTIVYDDASGKESGGIVHDTFTSATVTINDDADNFSAENITFENCYNRLDPDIPVSQAVALSCASDGASFYNCNFLGWQDTLYLHGESKQFFLDCYIEGSVDFIFGDAEVLFEDCDINCVREKSYVTAANTSEKSEVGFVFYHCYLSACEGCGSIYLGRPWRAQDDGICSATAFIECTYNLDLAPEGWLPWHLKAGEEKDNTRYFEYKNYDEHGNLADCSGRVQWSRQIKRSEAEDVMRYIGRIAKYPDDEHEHHEH